MHISHTAMEVSQIVGEEACESFWQQVIVGLKERLGEHAVKRWFTNVTLQKIDAEAVWVETPNLIFQVWIEENFEQVLQELLDAAIVDCPPVKMLIAGEEPEVTTASKLKGKKEKRATPEQECDAEQLDQNVSDIQRRGKKSGLSDRYSLDNFVVGENNRMSHAAAVAVAEKPGTKYSPLFIYSCSGLGKTHLMHAIGWEALRRRPKSTVLYISAEAFANDYITGLQNHSLGTFRKKYRKADILLIDDVHFLAGKEAMQEEFFHTFNTLMDGHKQIVISSDRPPGEIQSLQDRLVTRFQWGLSVEVQPPEIETRIAILRRKRDDWGVEVSDWVIEFVAERIRSNVRLMEGALMRVATVTSLNGESLDEDALEDLLMDFTREEDARDVTVDAIISSVAEHYDLRVVELTGRRRLARIALSRQVAMHLTRQLTGLSLKEIGEEFGGRDHGTVLHADRSIKAKMAETPSLRKAVEFLKRRLTRGGASSGRWRPEASMKKSTSYDMGKRSGNLQGKV
ncbi:MAG: chromosomal replication initiator protein DnaA [Verrucomicrobiales bacterium]|nr:chromosomal replication initiator protein DnaA [Verrucomicrobiales bacterium]